MFDQAPVLPAPAVTTTTSTESMTPMTPMAPIVPTHPAAGSAPSPYKGGTVGWPTLTLRQRCPLRHGGDCALIGVDPAGRVAIEEFYDDWLAQYAFSADGELLAICDEDFGADLEPEPLPEVNRFVAPPSPVAAAALNYTGGRWRGLREEERISEVALPLSILEKIALAGLRLPGAILGIAESYVLAEAVIRPGLSVIIRRVRIACAVPRHVGDDGAEVDYDSFPVYIAQWFDHSAEAAPLHEGVIDVGERPMDAQFDGRQLYIADGGAPGQPGELRIYTVEAG